ncbi:hypothetical protein Q31a_21460 [Aureliella helgolandensis]|uniref:Uncharacterized protein n=1 Tax=Aureliella helgolandensis TaxID=2527968 RepID=A0A518G5G9_9BACT|nr:hypothetical protein Q31a_21460 [Aureliella helgolandensis]
MTCAARPDVSRQANGLLKTSDALGRGCTVSAFSAMADDDGGSTVIQSEGNSLRFEKNDYLLTDTSLLTSLPI